MLNGGGAAPSQPQSKSLGRSDGPEQPRLQPFISSFPSPPPSPSPSDKPSEHGKRLRNQLNTNAKTSHNDDHKIRATTKTNNIGTTSGNDHAHLTRRRKNKMFRSGNGNTSPGAMYERLENGLNRLTGNGGPETGPRKIRFTWKKLAVAAAVFIGLVYVVGPRERLRMSRTDVQHTTGLAAIPTTTVATSTSTYDDLEAELPSTGKQTEFHPTSYETDPDPSKTTYCHTPSNPSLPLVHYALMIDAGSTGSRIHIYKFNNCGASPAFEYEVFKMTQPGLSAYAQRGQSPQEAAESLNVLMDEALRVVPEALRKCTPVAVKATAGLRLLPGTQSADILSAVEQRLVEAYPFKLVERDGVVVMDGKDEGVYAWITANYLMGTISEGVSSAGQRSTYAVLDLGGASTQIVFEPIFEKGDEALEEGEHKYDLKFAGKDHVLYQHSYLGYGLMRARMHVHQLVDFMDSVRATGRGKGNGKEGVVGNPCLAKGAKRQVEIVDERTGQKKKVVMDGEEVGSFAACNRVVQLVLAKDTVCELKPCSFDGVYQPSLLTSFPSGKVLLLSYFYDRLQPLLSSTSSNGTHTPITVSTLASYAQDVCEGRSRWLALWGSDAALMKELEDRPEWCLDLTFMYTLLRLGYEFEDGREVRLGKKIRGTELGWCLGATIAMVGGGELTCRV
ncbi:hypothetical protein AX17_006801 [Amanita inopinata Kibby_2008]|nr:hypothetical protein AX17_006801 [Amanita inopinata Kibby_2008]